MPKNNKVDFFGIKKTPNYLGGKSGKSNKKPLVSFLSSKKPLKINNKPRKNSGKNNLLNLNYKQAKRLYPKIKPWGDADLDGSPNKFDCKPFNASKDQPTPEELGITAIKKIAGIIGGKKKKKKPFAEQLVSQIEIQKPPKVDFEKIRRKLAKEAETKRKRKIEQFSSVGAGLRGLQSTIIKKFPSKKKFAQTRKGIQRAIALAGVPVKVEGRSKSKKGESVRAHAGRPKGSFKFSIPGVGPVPIHKYKKWIAEQKAKARIAALARVQAIQAGQQAPLDGEGEFQAEELPPQQFEEAPQPQPVAQLTPDQIRQIQQIRQQQLQQPQQVQQQGVPRDNLDFSTSSILTPQRNILQAPNISRGELRGVGEVPSVQLGDRPQTNPQGELFTNIDPVTGKAIVQRRIQSKFLTHGDADR